MVTTVKGQGHIAQVLECHVVFSTFFEGHFLTVPKKCHSACWSGLDLGKRKGKKRYGGENLERRIQHTALLNILS